MLRVYVARPISGCGYEEVVKYYLGVTRRIKATGSFVMHPMIGKEVLRTETKFRAHGYDNSPMTTNHAITQRDFWMVRTSDIVFVNLLGATEVSIGCCSELAVAHDHQKHTIVIMEKGNPHQHAFVLDEADVIFETFEDGFEYLEQLLNDCVDRYPYENRPEDRYKKLEQQCKEHHCQCKKDEAERRGVS